ncbi:MAG: glycoside hydrolase/phage tail family protein [Beijerinckiaceae bacterium]|nr:glycoside hydrolase/phage tail family protein [Beijerinckiaceae bacterium]MCZ8298645.1 glycoside hydrolase/phage tail family protein [Beijerinckiaceae bacterium]
MATLAFRMIGSTLGTMLGGPVGGMIGGTLGALAGAPLDRALLGGGRVTEGPRLDALAGITAQEGAPIPRIRGRVRLGGQVIWATEFEEERHVERAGGAGGKGLGSAGQPRATRYTYFAHVAIGLCEGPVSMVRRIWADDRELDLRQVTWRFYPGDEDQPVDPLIAAKQGGAALPAYRGLAYLVFERFPLADYGNRLPQFRFEVICAAGPLAGRLRAINLIPGSTEFGYAPEERREDFGFGASRAVNRAQTFRGNDWEASLDTLQALAPRLERVTLVSAWYGDDLRAGHCRFQPRTERADKVMIGPPWQVAGLTREAAMPVSRIDDRPAYGGSPSEDSLVAALRDLAARGLKPVLHPFVLMDIPPGNALPDPARPGGIQPAYPWRGRITLDLAPGQPAAAAQVAALMGAARPDHFMLQGGRVVYAGPEDWGYRRMVLHHAMLAQAAGGVDTLLLGSELVGLTHALGPDGHFPFVEALAALAADVRAMLGPATRLTYAADWTEYGARVREGGADIRFPLDTLWANPAIDAVAIDAYPPLSDWRPGRDHPDAALARGPADAAYLRASLSDGEAYAWFYRDEAARASGDRWPITDGAYGKPWIHRPKDLAGWWLNPHHERSGGVENPVPTAWQPGVKPVLLTEIGCPAVQFGANGPHLFPDPKSAEAGLPPFSPGGRDDLVPLRLIGAWLDGYGEGVTPENPVSPVTGQPMVRGDFIAPWAWDARPFPAFPRQTDLWSDGANWARGHWLNGRLEALPLDALVTALFTGFGLSAPHCEGVDGVVDGYVIDRPMGLRAALEPLARLFGLSFHARAGQIVVRGRPVGPVLTLSGEDLVPAPQGGALVERIRQPDSELPRRLSLGFIESEQDFEPAAVVAERPLGQTRREAAEGTTLHLPRAQAQGLAEQRLHDLWCGRETLTFRLSPRYLALEPGDGLRVMLEEGPLDLIVTRLVDGPFREVEARLYEPGLLEAAPPSTALPAPPPGPPAVPGRPHARLVELPLDRNEGLLALAVRAEPWGGPYRLVDLAGGGARMVLEAGLGARLGRTLSALPPGPLWRWDHQAVLDLHCEGGTLASLPEEAVLAGGNALAVTGPDGLTEILLFREATRLDARRFRLSGLLRGLGMSEPAARRICPAGADIVLLDDAVLPLGAEAATPGQPGRWRLIGAGVDLADPHALDLATTPSGLALRPLPPVHPRARREAAGIRFRFCRRTRRGGDSWDLFEVPLGEDRAEFRLALLAGEEERRVVTLAETEWLYPAAWEIADFGAPQGRLTFEIRQFSAAIGPGLPCRRTIPIH